MSFFSTLTYAQGIATILAIILNSFLVLILCRYSKKHIGKYKWLMMGYACFEMIYAIVVFIGMPINYIGHNSWIVFNHGGFIGDTQFAILGPTLYCVFYEVWISIVVVHFVYRYVALCKITWREKLISRTSILSFVFFCYAIHLFYLCFCAFFFCTANKIPEELYDDMRKVFDMSPNETIGYILFRLKSPSGNYSIGSIISFLNHYIYVFISIVLIVFCGFNIQKEIKNLQSQSIRLRDISLQKSIFRTLLIQTVIPIFLVHIPSGIYLTLPLLPFNISLGSATAIFSFLSTIPKIIDPIIVLCGIKDYRLAVQQIFCGRISGVVSTIKVSNYTSYQIR